MLEPVDVRRAIGTLLISDRHLENFQIEFRGAEEQVKVTEWIKIYEVPSIGGNSLVIFTEQDLGSPIFAYLRDRNWGRLSWGFVSITGKKRFAYSSLILLLHASARV